MRPSDEATAAARWGEHVVSGRDVINDVRARARAEYVGLVARAGATPIDGRTLRQALAGPGGYSRWWLLGPTEKDCVWDGDPTYTTILRLVALQHAQERSGAVRVRAFGAPRDFADALDAATKPISRALAQAFAAAAIGVAARVVLARELLAVWWRVRHLRSRDASAHRAVLLHGHWDWSVGIDGDGRLHDRYFEDLPAELARRGVTVGWLASCETDVQPWQRGRRARDVIAAAGAHAEVTLLEQYSRPADIMRAAIGTLRYAMRTTTFVLDRRFAALCRVGAFDVSSLVRRQLLRAAWGSAACRLELIAAATARACRALRPRIVMTIWDLLLRGRAIYAGVAASSTGATTWSAQHAGYSSDKTLGVFDPESEMRGRPDGCAVPAPDGIFVMGDLSRRVWQGSGLRPAQVVVTGGLRYESVRIRPRRRAAGRDGVSVLLACGMNEAAEVELCDAAVAAAAGLPSVSLRWRDHPAYAFSRRAAFRPFRAAVRVTTGTLDEDLEAADLVLFTHAGIAEEALLRGIPTWQWTWAGFNSSPFLDVPVIPSFASVAQLRRALEDFVRDPAAYQPTPEAQRRVLHECFGPEPAAASRRIADAIQRMLAAETPVVA